jgi:hypothetical protein
MAVHNTKVRAEKGLEQSMGRCDGSVGGSGHSQYHGKSHTVCGQRTVDGSMRWVTCDGSFTIPVMAAKMIFDGECGVDFPPIFHVAVGNATDLLQGVSCGIIAHIHASSRRVGSCDRNVSFLHVSFLHIAEGDATDLRGKVSTNIND